MSQKIYKVVALKELLAARTAAEVAEDEARAAKKRAEASQSVTTATFDAKPTVVTPEAKPFEAPEFSPHSDDMPDSLKGISALDLSLLEVDNLLTPAEQVWLSKRKSRYKEYRPYNPTSLDWML